jgi:hypothetical protein
VSVDNENARQQALAQIESIVEMVAAARSASSDAERDAAEQRIHEDPLSVEVRTEWHSVGADHTTAAEFKIDLCTGGPAVRIIGDLNQYEEPETAGVQYQDWFTPWHTLHGLTEAENEALLEYCRQFYFAECVTS